MSPFPLQNELINAVVAFANAESLDEQHIRRHFKNTWTPDKIPQLRTLIEIQQEVREWLFKARYLPDGDVEHGFALHGLRIELGPEVVRVDPGILLEGKISIDQVPILGGFKEQIVWTWKVKQASLRAICGLAMATICQEGLHKRIGECAREGCGNIFLDQSSRGNKRKYCKSAECDAKLNQMRVEQSRKKRAKK